MSSYPIYPVFGECIEILVESKATNNTFVVARQTSPPGGGPPPHKLEREEEIFMVLAGDYEFFDGESWTAFNNGSMYFTQCPSG